MAKWHDLTEEERDRYINQDVVDRTWRERLSVEIGHSCFNSMADRSGMSNTLSSGNGCWDSLFEGKIDPVELECLRLFYIEGKSRIEIAETISIQYFSQGKLIMEKGATLLFVKRKLEDGRSKIRSLYGTNVPFSLLVRGNNTTN
jgi:hypothetical protein